MLTTDKLDLDDKEIPWVVMHRALKFLLVATTLKKWTTAKTARGYNTKRKKLASDIGRIKKLSTLKTIHMTILRQLG